MRSLKSKKKNLALASCYCLSRELWPGDYCLSRELWPGDWWKLICWGKSRFYNFSYPGESKNVSNLQKKLEYATCKLIEHEKGEFLTCYSFLSSFLPSFLPSFLTAWLTDGLTDRPTDRPTDWRTHWLTRLLTNLDVYILWNHISAARFIKAWCVVKFFKSELDFLFFLYQGFLSRTLLIQGIAGKGGVYFYPSVSP